MSTQNHRVTIFLTFALLFQVYLLFYLQSRVAKKSHVSVPVKPRANVTSKKVDLVRSPKPQPLNFLKTSSKDYKRSRYFYQRGNYTVLTNYVQGTAVYDELSTITLVTHATLDYLDHIQTLVTFWNGPISLTVYAPGPEFDLTLTKIAFFRRCSPKPVASAIKTNVTFHIFFETSFLPKLPAGMNFYELDLPVVICRSKKQKWMPNPRSKVNFRKTNHLLYPINVARNVAKEYARTHFVFVSDIELLPNPPDFIPKFLDLIQRRMSQGEQLTREVFVLPPFELSKLVKPEEIPRSKVALQALLKSKRTLAFPFHFFACFLCHRIPYQWEWMHQKSLEKDAESLNIFQSTPYITTSAWEPFYVGTRWDPPFDEGFFRETALNKVIQAAILCHQNYTFHILDTAFLVHLPGIRYGRSFNSQALKTKGIKLARTQILPLQFSLYGKISNRCWQINSTKPNPTNDNNI